MIRAYLGGTIDHAQTWSYSGDANWHEAGDGNWRVSIIPGTVGKVRLTASLHIRSGDGNTGYQRLYNKFRITRIAPTTWSSLDSENLVEATNNIGLRFLDGSRSWIDVDENPVVEQINTYCVEIVAGDGIHTEVSYGSTLIAELV